MSEQETVKLFLITPEQLKLVPDGTVLTCINGRSVIKGTDYLDGDTRGGYLAYGFRTDDKFPEGIELDSEAFIDVKPL